MRKADAAYFAGFFDGEGSITMSLNKGKYLRLEVAVSQNTQDVLWMHVRAFRGNIYQGQRCLQWKLHGAEAVAFLRTVLPFLIVKRTDATEAIEAWNRRDDPVYVTDVIAGRKVRHERLKQHYDTVEATRRAVRGDLEGSGSSDGASEGTVQPVSGIGPLDGPQLGSDPE